MAANPTDSTSPAAARIRLPIREDYVIPPHCSSCDVEVESDAHRYSLRLEPTGRGKKGDAPTLMLPLCEHCRRRRLWDRAGAGVGLIFGGVALVVMYPLLEQANVALAVVTAIVVFFGTAVAFSILWTRATDRFIGPPRFENVLYNRPRGADHVVFVFHHTGYGERFRDGNAASDSLSETPEGE